MRGAASFLLLAVAFFSLHPRQMEASSLQPQKSQLKREIPVPYSEQDAEQRLNWIQQGRQLHSVAERLEHLSRPFLETPYMVGPLGEGSGRSPGPRIRWDGVDCLTFVETVMAMSRLSSPPDLGWGPRKHQELATAKGFSSSNSSSSDSTSCTTAHSTTEPGARPGCQPEAGSEAVATPHLSGSPSNRRPAESSDPVLSRSSASESKAVAADKALLAILDDIRYASLPPHYTRRNHFAEAQWIPNNIAKGYLEDISVELFGEQAQRLQTHFSPERWDRQRRPGVVLLKRDEIPYGDFELSMIPLDIIRSAYRQIPAGTLLFVVRQDIESEPTLITHLGMVFDGPKGKVLRHAAQRPYLRVIDEPLNAFLYRNSRYTRRPVIGVALFRILDEVRHVPTAHID